MSAEFVDCPVCGQKNSLDAGAARDKAMCSLCGARLFPEAVAPTQDPGPNPNVPRPPAPPKVKKKHTGRNVLIVVLILVVAVVVWNVVAPMLSSSSNTPASTPTSPTWPAGAIACDSTSAVSVKGHCAYAMAVRSAYAKTSKTGKKTISLKNINDPAVKKSFTVTCTVAATAKCTSTTTKTIVWVK